MFIQNFAREAFKSESNKDDQNNFEYEMLAKLVTNGKFIFWFINFNFV
jgi:hypothetical protein